jgi:hypothetical protein
MKWIFQRDYFLLAVYQEGQLITMINNGEDVAQVNASGITNMRSLFKDAPSFSQDIGSWNASNVTQYEEYFLYAGPGNIEPIWP